MGTRNVSADLIAFDLGQLVEQRRFKLSRVIYRKVAVGIMDDPIRGTFAIGLFHQQAVGSDLKNVGIIRRGRRTPRFDLNGYDHPVPFDQIIRFAGESQLVIHQGLLELAPGARIGIDHAPAGQTGLASLAIGLPKKDYCEK